MRYILLAVVVLMILVDQTNGLRCQPCNAQKCVKPSGCRRKNYVKDLCNCCDVCPTKFGQPCSGLKPKCSGNMWCINIEENKAEARKNLVWSDSFRGVCGRIRLPRMQRPAW